MIFEEKEIEVKNGKKVTFRSAKVEDATMLIEYLKGTATETRFLTREPDERKITLEQQEGFLKSKEENPRELMLIGIMDGEHVGNCSFSQAGAHRRYAHRCQIGIALYQKFWGNGIGRKMFEIILDEAKKCGYEQAELEVVATNTKAIELYKSFGFEIYGTHKNDMKYADGTYADAHYMVKSLI